MIAGPLVIHGARSTLQRLRREAGCDRLKEGDGISWVDLESLDDLARHLEGLRAGVGTSDAERRVELLSRLGRLLSIGRPELVPLRVLVWEAPSISQTEFRTDEADERGEQESTGRPTLDLNTEERLLGVLAAELQADRVRTTGRRGVSDRAILMDVLIAILPDGFKGLGDKAEETVNILRRWASQVPGSPEGYGLPVYLMTDVGRMATDGDLWPSSRVWPVAVGRLISSLSVQPSRIPGLRAWRSFALVGAEKELDPVGEATRRAELQILNYGVEGSESGRNDGKERDLGEIKWPSKDVRIDFSVPKHPLDHYGGRGDQERLQLADWWELGDKDDLHSLGSREASIPYQRSTRTEFSQNKSQGSSNEWNGRMKERGEAFRKGRLEEDSQEIKALFGNDSLHGWSWKLIHEDPIRVDLIRSNGFMRRDPDDGTPFVERLDQDLGAQHTSQIDSSHPGNIQAADDQRKRAIEEAVVVTEHLQTARRSFVSLGWRLACACAGALFASSAIGSLPVGPILRGGGWDWAIQVGVYAAAGSAVASVTLLLLEWRAGKRAASVAEDKLQVAEKSIANSFLKRLELLRNGINLRKHTISLQSAAAVSDSAQRLKAMMDRDSSGVHAGSGGDGSDEDLEEGCVSKRYQQATTGVLTPPLTREMLEDEFSTANPGWLGKEAEEYLTWWEKNLDKLDPNIVGSLRERAFVEAWTGRWSEIRRRLRQRFRGQVINHFHSNAVAMKAGPVGVWVGASSDIPGLSCLTSRAATWERRRWMHVMAPDRSLLDAIGSELRPRLGSDVAVSMATTETDGWGGLALIVDEIDVTILDPGEGRVVGIEDREPAAEWRVMEGARRTNADPSGAGGHDHA